MRNYRKRKLEKHGFLKMNKMRIKNTPNHCVGGLGENALGKCGLLAFSFFNAKMTGKFYLIRKFLSCTISAQMFEIVQCVEKHAPILLHLQVHGNVAL